MGNTLECIGDWISQQRWYAGKGHVPRLRELSRQVIPSDDPAARVSIVLVMDDEGHVPTLYQVPVVERDELQPSERPFLIGRNDEGSYLFDGPHDPAFPRALLRVLAPELADEARVTATRVLAAEQSNTSIIYDIDGVPSVICKVFRTLHHGDNPDVTLPAALSLAGSTAVPKYVGQLRSEWDDVGRPGGRAAGHLAFAQEFLAGADDGWKVALKSASAGDDFSTLARALGEQTARVHATLAEVMPTSDAEPADVAAFVASWTSRLALATREIPALFEHREAIASIYAEAEAGRWPSLQRIHGDFHLGQALLVPERGWVLVDFEGEPLRPMDERDRPDVPLRDVAGMLRSFDYAAGSTPGVPHDWASSAREAFLEGYIAASGADLASFRPLLNAFELDKAVYEAVYEARNRPGWLRIPLRGIDQLVARRLDPSTAS
ncbi:maltokinase [Conyzicola nivalis]|uniref:Maltokinase n=1 Tax=Conyzicola nivalis TaxID=1477021 RepID=A0ABV2QJM7_9MICO